MNKSITEAVQVLKNKIEPMFDSLKKFEGEVASEVPTEILADFQSYETYFNGNAMYHEGRYMPVNFDDLGNKHNMTHTDVAYVFSHIRDIKAALIMEINSI